MTARVPPVAATTGQPPTVDTFTALAETVAVLDRRFPDHNSPFARLSRLLEEAGELAQQVHHAEGMGVKNTKHGEFEPEHLAKEVMDVLRCAIGVAGHYGVIGQVRDLISSHHARFRELGYLDAADSEAADQPSQGR
jgi:NTP pyrophosphatase (non-canonical NTP hydrolase)